MIYPPCAGSDNLCGLSVRTLIQFSSSWGVTSRSGSGTVTAETYPLCGERQGRLDGETHPQYFPCVGRDNDLCGKKQLQRSVSPLRGDRQEVLAGGGIGRNRLSPARGAKTSDRTGQFYCHWYFPRAGSYNMAGRSFRRCISLCGERQLRCVSVCRCCLGYPLGGERKVRCCRSPLEGCSKLSA